MRWIQLDEYVVVVRIVSTGSQRGDLSFVPSDKIVIAGSLNVRENSLNRRLGLTAYRMGKGIDNRYQETEKFPAK